MTVAEKIKILCVRNNISMAELARRLDNSPANFSAKLKRESFTLEDYKKMAEVTNSKFEFYFELENGDRI